ncbi:MAG TPA: toll/interleukin-1 receptor domain-containing protein [Methylococcaceae bacterium]|nr:toll/interleukin-1 receptor domain-containing protein [Methylococcaceae bacterium]
MCVDQARRLQGRWMSELPDYFWDDLLEYIEDGKVIPIVGPELVTVAAGDGEIPLYSHIANKLAERLRVPVSDLTSGYYSLNDVVCRFLDNRGRKEEIYPRIRALLKEAAFPPPPRLLDLARIHHFKLFVSVTFDSLLADAINTIRFGGNAKTEVIAYSPNDVQDLRSEKKNLDRPLVYHLLGKLSASPDYVVCDEDRIEFMQAMQQDSRRPHLLFDELKDNHLLILGCSMPDWLARFFIRLAKNQPLSMRRDQMEVLVDSLVVNTNLAVFLEHFSYNSKVISGGAAEFVTELSRRWQERHPEAESPAAPAAAPVAGSDTYQMESGAIFLSYASDDLEAVERIKTALEKAGLDVWFDKRQLAAGDDWDQKIRRNVANCSLFLPIVSNATECRLEGYFRREWAWAADRALGIADEIPFIIPVTIDETPAYTAKVPERFRRSQFTQLTGGQVSSEFTERLKQLVRDYHRRQRGG